MSEMSVPSPYRRDKEVFHVRTGEKLNFETRWSEAQLALFRDDMEKVLTAAGFQVREWTQDDPEGFNTPTADRLATLESSSGNQVVIAFSPRMPNNSNIQFYRVVDGQRQAGPANHDMTASEFLQTLKGEVGTAISDAVQSTPEYQRMRNWTDYDNLEV